MLVEHGLGVCGSVLFSVESLLLGTIFFFFLLASKSPMTTSASQ